MIRGELNAEREAVVPVTVRAVGGREISLQAIIDTGFSGYLTLPPEQVADLELPFVERRAYVLGDNQEREFDVHAVIVNWDGNDRGILTLSSDGPPTVGMALLYGFRLLIDVVDGGEVTVEARSAA